MTITPTIINRLGENYSIKSCRTRQTFLYKPNGINISYSITLHG